MVTFVDADGMLVEAKRFKELIARSSAIKYN